MSVFCAHDHDTTNDQATATAFTMATRSLIQDFPNLSVGREGLSAKSQTAAVSDGVGEARAIVLNALLKCRLSTCTGFQLRQLQLAQFL